MKIRLVTGFKSAPSTVLNTSLLTHLPDFELLSEIPMQADVILFMGYDPKIDDVKKNNPKAIIGIIDPRPGSESELKKVDFYLANGVEMVNYFSASNSNYFIYPIYPPLEYRVYQENKYQNKKIKIAYHGNKAHLQLMEQTVCKALEKLANEFNKYEIELTCLYNVSHLGRWEWQPKQKNIIIKHVQWSDTGYTKDLSNTHIGITPNLIPFEPIKSKKDHLLEEQKLAFDSDMCFRFKPTSNLGRILVFAQLGIPVISDMFPSAAEIIRHGYNGLLATDADSWYIHLKRLIANEDERKKMAENMYEVFMNHYHWGVKNKELMEFFAQQIEFKRSQTTTLKERIKQLFS